MNDELRIMKVKLIIAACILLLQYNSTAKGLPGDLETGTAASASPAASVDGVTVAGGNGRGAAANQLNNPLSVFVDSAGNVYVADFFNNRIQKWAPGSTTGVTAVSDTYGNNPRDVFVDAAGNIYVANGTRQVKKYAPGSSVGVVVANNTSSNSGTAPYYSCVFVDAALNVYVADPITDRVEKWAPGASAGIVVAGGNGDGERPNQLSVPLDIVVDKSGNIYIADRNRVQRLAPGAAEGVTIASFFSDASSIFIDANGNLFVADSYKHSIVKWAPGAISGVTVAGGNGAGSAANQVNVAAGVFLDQAGNIYVADQNNNRIQKFGLPQAEDLGSPAMGVKVAGSYYSGSQANELNQPKAVTEDAQGNIYVSDYLNHRVQKWAPGASTGETVAGGNGTGSGPNQINYPDGVAVDGQGNVFVTDGSNSRIQKWVPGALQGVTVAGGNGQGSSANQLSYPQGIALDQAGNIYIADFFNNRIQKWAPGATTGVTVAGGNGPGSAANQINGAYGVFVDAVGNIYVSESYNNRIQKWVPGAAEGITVAGGNGSGGASNQLNSSWGLHVDADGTIHVADYNNHRIQKWLPGATKGVTVAGGNGPGSQSNQLYFPTGLFANANGDIFVADLGNHRIQKFGLHNLSYKYYEGIWSTLPDFNSLIPVRTGNSANIDINQRTPGRNENFAFIWNGTINILTPGNYIFETLSDDGSNFYFNTPYSAGATPLIDNDGLHGNKTVSGSINVATAGTYPVSISYFNASGAGQVKAYWSGPGIPRQLIPDAAFSSDLVKDNIAPGIPSYLQVVSSGGNFITLDWDNGFDNVGVIAFDIYIGGVKAYTTAESGITIGNLAPNTSYSISILARDLAGNASPLSYAITANTTSSINGLSFKYYEGSWELLPDFNTLTPVKTGNSNNLELGERTPGRNDNFAFLWQGYLNITTPGTYVFETISDDGSKFYFNSLYNPAASATINNDGLHGSTAVSSTVSIPAVGLYPVTITYFEKDGGEQMELYWSGPGISRQPIPNSAFSQLPAPSGLTYKYYEGTWSALPDFRALTPVQTGTTSNIKISEKPQNRSDYFAFLWEGYITIPAAGIYTFETLSDDGSNLYFNMPYAAFATPTINNDGLHGAKSVAKTINIAAAGSYPISITYFDQEGGDSMQVFWSGPGISRQPIPDEAFNAGAKTDSVAPSIPLNIHLLSKGGNFIELDWDDASDNIGVIAYDVYLGGVKSYTVSESRVNADNLSANTLYAITIKARDLAGNTSGFSNVFTETTGNTLNGLSYKYYEGEWSELPDFNNQSPVKIGNSLNIDLSARRTGRDDKFAFVWQGYINIPTAGEYIFETVSDDGSKLYFNTFYNPAVTPVVSNDGLHASFSATGKVIVTAAGSYPIAITYFDRDGGEQMQVYWSGPGFERQLIPNAAFIQIAPPRNGLAYKYYEGTWNSLPDFTALVPVKSGTTDNIDISIRPAGRNDNFGFVWEGYINIPTAGNYTFESVSDDGSKIYFNVPYSTDAVASVFNDGTHAPRSSTRVVFIPVAGYYQFAAIYFDKDGGEQMQVYWTGPGITRQLIPNSAFTLTPPPPVSAVLQTGFTRLQATTDKPGTILPSGRIYPNPFNETINVHFYNSNAHNDIQLAIYDLEGKLLYNYQANKMPTGNNVLKVNIQAYLRYKGQYTAQLKINGLPVITSKLIKLR